MKPLTKRRLKKIAQIYVGSLLVQEDEVNSNGLLGAQGEGELMELIHRWGREVLGRNEPQGSLADVVKKVLSEDL